MDEKAVKKKKSIKDIFKPSRKKSNKSLQSLPLLEDEAVFTASVEDNPLPAGAALLATTPPTTFGEILGEKTPGRELDHDILHATNALWGNKVYANASQAQPSGSTLQSFPAPQRLTPKPLFSNASVQSHTVSGKPKLHVSTPATVDWASVSSKVAQSYPSSSSPETTPTQSSINTPKHQDSARLQRKETALPDQCQRVVWDPTHSFKDSAISGQSRSSGTVNSPSTMRSSVFTKASAVTDTTVDVESPADRAKSMTEEDAIDLYMGGFQDDKCPHDAFQSQFEQVRADPDMFDTQLGMNSQDPVKPVEKKDCEEVVGHPKEHTETGQGLSNGAATVKISKEIVETAKDKMVDDATLPSTQQVAETKTSSPALPPATLLSVTICGSWFWRSPVLSPATLTHDKYGFKKTTRDISLEEYELWYNGYMPYQDSRAAKWCKLLESHGLDPTNLKEFPKRSGKIERFIRKGVPSGWRGQVWFFYSGGKTAFEKNPTHYSSLVIKCQTPALLVKDKEAIERDLHRTFPENIFFKPLNTDSDAASPETPILKALRRVLRAFAVEHPEIGYCQSLNFLAGMLLLFLSEEQAFWMLHVITTEILPGSHEESLEGTDIDTWVLMQALRSHHPAVWAKVGENTKSNTRYLPEVSMCTTSWFMSAFIGNLPVESVLRIWDIMFYRGSVALFQIALAIFKYGEQEIAKIQDPMETLQVIQNIPRKMLDVVGLFEIAYRKQLDSRYICRKRWERKEYLRKHRRAEKKA